MSAGTASPTLRILLVEPQEPVRSARAQKLLARGYQVSALGDGESAPSVFPQRLYDVIVVSAQDSSLALRWCEQVSGGSATPLIIVMAEGLFSMDSGLLPSVVISEATPQAAEEKLLAFLESARPGCPA